MSIDRAPDPAAANPLWKRLAWFAALWTASVITILSVAYFIRWWLV